MAKKRTNKIWFIPKEELIEAVKNSKSLSSVLKRFSIEIAGFNFSRLKQRMEEDKIDFSHISLGQNSNKGRKFPTNKKINIERLLITNSSYPRGSLKKRLIEEKILEVKCFICGLSPSWNNKPLVMVLDHKNGIKNDNRLENLRLLCPNCNSQTSTFSGRNTKRIKKSRKIKCKQCDNLCCMESQSGLCLKCFRKTAQYGKGFLNKKHTGIVKEILSFSHLGEKNSQYGSKWMNDSIEVKKVSKNNIEEYLNKGWKFGRKLNI